MLFRNLRPLSLKPLPRKTRVALLSSSATWTLLLLVLLAVHFAALFSPSLLDDADATHANAAQSMAAAGDWVTLKVNGIRYLEKPPLPYWLVAADYHLFGYNVFATHLPLALGVLGCAILAWVWAPSRLWRPCRVLCRPRRADLASASFSSPASSFPKSC